MNANEGTHNLFILLSSPSCSPVTFLLHDTWWNQWDDVGRGETCGWPTTASEIFWWVWPDFSPDFFICRFFQIFAMWFFLNSTTVDIILNCINIIGFCWNYGRRWSFVNFNEFQKPHLPVLLPPGPRGFTVSWLHWGGPRAVALRVRRG